MESLQNILRGKKITAPDEFTTVRDYVRKRYNSDCSVKLQRGALIVSVPNGALAATMQLERQSFIKACKLADKKLVILNGK